MPFATPVWREPPELRAPTSALAAPDTSPAPDPAPRFPGGKPGRAARTREVDSGAAPPFGFRVLTLVLALLGAATNAFGAPPDSQSPAQISARLRARAEATYTNAHREWVNGQQNPQLAWEFARACFDSAEFADSNARRADLANQGIAAAEQALRLDTNSVAAHYYLGMNLGQLARTKGLGALRLVHRMRNEFLAARAVGEQFDFAGPDRNLGMLYRDAPPIASVGNRKEALRCLERATDLAPGYPENRLALIEALVKWKENDRAREHLKLLEEQWADAQARLSGPEWEGSWLSWEEAKRSLKKKLAERE